ncbi:MAG: hypothetical protein VKJ46_08685 [Leptolyngbyaceae bacterium]|nr:hypothetical protein [Leptolyngbyaceae bacterium]
MSIQKLPLEAVQKIRQHIKSSLVLPESENHPNSQASDASAGELSDLESLDALGDWFKFASVPEEAANAPNTEGQWFVSTINPGVAITKLPGLSLKPGFRIVTYLNRAPDSGVGSTWVVPEAMSTTAQLEEALQHCGDITQPPHPKGALTDLMEAISGDFSPPSFIVASLLRRELQELGALGKYCKWSHHRLINTVPPQVKWQWRTDIPKDLSPKVRVLENGKTAIEFFTCRVVAPVAIFRHIDQYQPGQYQATSVDQAIAVI